MWDICTSHINLDIILSDFRKIWKTKKKNTLKRKKGKSIYSNHTKLNNNSIVSELDRQFIRNHWFIFTWSVEEIVFMNNVSLFFFIFLRNVEKKVPHMVPQIKFVEYTFSEEIPDLRKNWNFACCHTVHFLNFGYSPLPFCIEIQYSKLFTWES